MEFVSGETACCLVLFIYTYATPKTSTTTTTVSIFYCSYTRIIANANVLVSYGDI